MRTKDRLSWGLVRSLLITDPLIIFTTIVMGSVNLLVSLFETDGRRQVAIARAWSKMLILIAGVKLTIEGLEHIDLQGNYIFVSNHLSYMDTPVVLGHIPVQFRFMAKEELFRIPFLGYHLTRAGHIKVPRQDPRAAIRGMNDAARYIQERGVSVLIFPEGGRSDGTLQKFKEGAAYIAIKSGAPVVPIALIGTQIVLPMHSLNIRPGKVTMRIGRPIPTKELAIADRGALTETLHTKVAGLLANQSQPSEPVSQ